MFISCDIKGNWLDTLIVVAVFGTNLSDVLRFNFKEKVSSGSIERLGVIDIGSNSVRLVVFDGAARSPAYFYNEKVICSLGSDLSSDN